jgi:uncharacterized protein DUF2799
MAVNGARVIAMTALRHPSIRQLGDILRYANATRQLLPLTAGLLLLPALLGGCATMTAEECSVLDWRSVGYEDGVAGLPGNHISHYREACAKHGVATDLSAYQAGRAMGLREYCQPANGFRVGARGDSYQGVCPAPLEQDFLGAYNSGHELYTLEWRASNATRQLADRRNEINRIEQGMVSDAAVLVAQDSTAETRAHALVDTNQLAERKGRVEAEIVELERDRARYQQDLESYRATLAANR